MFFVADKQQYKKIIIRSYLKKEPMIAVLLAAANFEWTCGRCILFLSKTPNIELREMLYKTYGLDKYKELWKNEIIRFDSKILPLANVVVNWGEFKVAFNLRHKLIHGRGTCSRNMAFDPVNIMLSAVDDLYAFTSKQGIDLHKRLPIRRRLRTT
jgi:hypothetical protein